MPEWLSTVLVAVFALLGTLGGSWFGVRESNRLVNHRLEKLESEVREHNRLVERMAIVERDVKTAYNRLDNHEGRVVRIEREGAKM